MQTPESTFTLSSLSLASSPSSIQLAPIVFSVSALRLSGKEIFYWEQNRFNPKKESCWMRLTHVIIEELWVNQDSEVQMGAPHPERSELTHIRNYLPWLRQLKMMYPWIQFIWSFHRNPSHLFVEGSFWKSFVQLVFDQGKDLFDGVEMNETLAKITCKYYGIHCKDITHWPPLSKFDIWIRLSSLEHLKKYSFASHFVVDSHSSEPRQDLMRTFTFLKDLSHLGVKMDKVILDMNCERSYDDLSMRKNKLQLFYDYELAGLSFFRLVQDFVPESKTDMLSQAYCHPFAE